MRRRGERRRGEEERKASPLPSSLTATPPLSSSLSLSSSPRLLLLYPLSLPLLSY